MEEDNKVYASVFSIYQYPRCRTMSNLAKKPKTIFTKKTEEKIEEREGGERERRRGRGKGNERRGNERGKARDVG